VLAESEGAALGALDDDGVAVDFAVHLAWRGAGLAPANEYMCQDSQVHESPLRVPNNGCNHRRNEAECKRGLEPRVESERGRHVVVWDPGNLCHTDGRAAVNRV
jgi:hypothetical protein